MKKIALQLLALLALISFSCLSASADTIYTLTALAGFSNEFTVNLTVDSPTYLNSGSTTVPDSEVTCTISGGYSCNFVTFNAAYPGFDQLSFSTNAGGGFGEAYYFAVGSFGTDGTYNETLCSNDCTGRGAVFTVSETPEPGSLALLGSGLLGLAGGIRRKILN